MRLWHYKLIPFLPTNQILGQHRECCALRGLGWGKKHSVVNYVFKHSYTKLVFYHFQIMQEMIKRHFNINKNWLIVSYRGKRIGIDSNVLLCVKDFSNYNEHDDKYLLECLLNLKYGTNKRGKVKNIDLFPFFNEIKLDDIVISQFNFGA